MRIGWTSGVTAGEVSADANDLAGTDVQTQLDDAGARILALESSPGGAADFTSTYWVDPNGSDLVDGLSPTKPTTLAHVLTLAASGSRIELAAGTYAGETIPTDGLTFVGAAAQSTASATASVRFTSGVTLDGRNCHFVGVQFGALTDASGAAGAGTTVLEQCALQGTLMISNPATTAVHLISTSFADITASGTNAGCTVRLRDCPSGGTITNATTGLLTTIAAGSSFAGITQTAAGTQAIEISGGCYLSSGITRSAGSTVSVLLEQSNMAGAIDATGAGPNSVQIIASTFDRNGSTNLAAAEGGSVTHDTALHYAPSTPGLWQTLPTNVRQALDLLANRALQPVYWALRGAALTTANPPTSPLPFLTLGKAALPSQLTSTITPIPIDPAGVYIFLVTYTAKVTASNTRVWTTLLINGAPPPIGAFDVPLGAADAQAPFSVAGPYPGFVFGAPAVDFEVQVAKAAGTGDVILQSAGLLLMRVS